MLKTKLYFIKGYFMLAPRNRISLLTLHLSESSIRLATFMLLSSACGISTVFVANPTQDGGAQDAGVKDSATSLLSDGSSATSDASALTCDTKKIKFTQKTGCLNDGSVEFCIPLDGVALSTVRRIEDSVSYDPQGIGRARCNQSNKPEYLVTFYTSKQNTLVCAPSSTSSASPMTNLAWAKLCQFAALSYVKEIVPTWRE